MPPPVASPSPLDPLASGRVAKEFPGSEQSLVAELLTRYSGPEPDRVRQGILNLSKGSRESVAKYTEAARIDYRDILYWAEYYDNDPLLRGRDPQALAQSILDKWGNPPKIDPQSRPS